MISKPFFYSIIISVMVCFNILYINNSFAQDKMRGPSEFKPEDNDEAYGKGKNMMLNLYQQRISPVKNSRQCPMYPSCSQYTKIAFQKLSWYKAYFKSCERILRCGRELYFYHRIRVNGAIRWYDPLLIGESSNENEIQHFNF